MWALLLGMLHQNKQRKGRLCPERPHWRRQRYQTFALDPGAVPGSSINGGDTGFDKARVSELKRQR